MEGATHFIEQYNTKPEYKKGYNDEKFTEVSPIARMEDTLRHTREKISLHTVAVFKIKLKPSALIASFDPEVSATVIEKA